MANLRPKSSLGTQGHGEGRSLGHTVNTAAGYRMLLVALGKEELREESRWGVVKMSW